MLNKFADDTKLVVNTLEIKLSDCDTLEEQTENNRLKN